MSEPQPPYGPPASGWTGAGWTGAAQGGAPAWGSSPPGSVPSWGPGTPGSSPVGYGPGPGSGGPQETSSRAIVALVLAVGAYVVLPFFAAVAALVVARGADREIAAAGGRLTGRGLVTAAKVVAWVNIALCVLGVLLVAVVIGLFAAGASTS